MNEISSKHDRDHNIQAEFKLKYFSHYLHASLFAKMSGSVFFDTHLMNFIRKFFFILDY